MYVQATLFPPNAKFRRLSLLCACICMLSFKLKFSQAFKLEFSLYLRATAWGCPGAHGVLTHCRLYTIVLKWHLPCSQCNF